MQYIVFTSGKTAKLLHPTAPDIGVNEGHYTGGQAVTWLEQSPGMFAVIAESAEEAEFRVLQFHHDNLVPEKSDSDIDCGTYELTILGCIKLET